MLNTHKIAIIGEDDDSEFAFTINANDVIAALEVAALGESRDDIVAELDNFGGIERKCIDAICWEAEETIATFITLIKGHGRFAICHNDLEFGVGSDNNQAVCAWSNEEF